MCVFRLYMCVCVCSDVRHKPTADMRHFQPQMRLYVCSRVEICKCACTVITARVYCELLNGTYISVYIHGMRHGNADCISRLCFALPLATTCYPLQCVYVRLLQATSKPIDIVCTFVAHDSYAAK